MYTVTEECKYIYIYSCRVRGRLGSLYNNIIKVRERMGRPEC